MSHHRCKETGASVADAIYMLDLWNSFTTMGGQKLGV